MNNLEKFGSILLLYGFLIILSISSISLILAILRLLEHLMNFSAFLSEIISFLTFNNDVVTLGAYQYMASIFTLFPASFIVFYLIVEFLRNKKPFNFLNEFLNTYSRSFLALYSINISFFGFLTLFFTLLNIDGQISEKLLYITAGLTMSTLFPYFYQLVVDAKQSEWKYELESRDDTDNKINTENTKKIRGNKKIDNIYFVLTIVFLIFIFVLIFFMYQQAFDFSEFIDLKTLLTVMGTIFGAYFGAKTAGKYAIRSVEKQIQNQEDKESMKSAQRILRAAHLYHAHLSSTQIVTEKYVPIFNESNENPFTQIEISEIDFAKKQIENELIILKSIDISEIWDDVHFLFLGAIIPVETIIHALEFLKESVENENQVQYFHSYEAFSEDAADIDRQIEAINSLISSYS